MYSNKNMFVLWVHFIWSIRDICKYVANVFQVQINAQMQKLPFSRKNIFFKKSKIKIYNWIFLWKFNQKSYWNRLLSSIKDIILYWNMIILKTKTSCGEDMGTHFQPNDKYFIRISLNCMFYNWMIYMEWFCHHNNFIRIQLNLSTDANKDSIIP